MQYNLVYIHPLCLYMCVHVSLHAYTISSYKDPPVLNTNTTLIDNEHQYISLGTGKSMSEFS